MSVPIVLVVLAIVMIVLFIKIAMSGYHHRSGGPANVMYGAMQELMTHDQRRAARVIVKKQSGEKEEGQTSGEPKTVKSNKEMSDG